MHMSKCLLVIILTILKQKKIILLKMTLQGLGRKPGGWSPEGQLRKFAIFVIIFMILARFRVEIYDFSNFQIPLFLKAFGTILNHFLITWNVLSLSFMTYYSQ